ncbi:MAG: RelA/SpoT family protein [Candidatus Binatia bacterium]
MSLGDLITSVRDFHPGADIDLISSAYEFSEAVHRGQKRRSGEPYLVHPLAVARILADMKLDVASIVTGLLHDTVEDTLTTLEEISRRFGPEVASLVDGVTKISLMEADDREVVEAESLRKVFLASARDVRVLLVKLADRAHNLRTIEHLPEENQRRMARETLELYAPLALRLGINWLKSEFEENCFRTLWPGEYEQLREKLSLNRVDREGYIQEITGLLGKRLKETGLEVAVSGRTKSGFSIRRKMQGQGLRYDDVHDVVAFRILVDSRTECYEALGVVHANWRPIPGRFRDYIALPKENMYQSLHTTVIGPYGERMEVQIRTHEMHRVAEFGIAAHWKYKSGDVDNDEDRLAWLRQVLEWQKVKDPREFIDSFKEDITAEEVYVFTPRGEAITLPTGASIVDFAYRIHTDVGNHCAGARVNGQLVPIRYQLQQGDTVEILTTTDSAPSRDWLKFVSTHRARERILSRLKQEERTHAIGLGQAIMERDLSRHQLDLARLRREGKMADLLRQFRKASENEFLEALGFGRITSASVLDYLVPDHEMEDKKYRRSFRRILGMLARQPRSPVTVKGEEETVVRFGKCCQPLPGEAVVGFVTRGRGITVHSSDCQRLADSDLRRRVEVSWEKGARALRPVRVEISSRDRPGMLAEMSQAITSSGVNIERAYVRTTGEDKALNVFDMMLGHADELKRVLRNLSRVPGVREVRRIRS